MRTYGPSQPRSRPAPWLPPHYRGPPLGFSHSPCTQLPQTAPLRPPPANRVLGPGLPAWCRSLRRHGVTAAAACRSHRQPDPPPRFHAPPLHPVPCKNMKNLTRYTRRPRDFQPKFLLCIYACWWRVLKPMSAAPWLAPLHGAPPPGFPSAPYRCPPPGIGPCPPRTTPWRLLVFILSVTPAPPLTFELSEGDSRSTPYLRLSARPIPSRPLPTASRQQLPLSVPPPSAHAAGLLVARFSYVLRLGLLPVHRRTPHAAGGQSFCLAAAKHPPCTASQSTARLGLLRTDMAFLRLPPARPRPPPSAPVSLPPCRPTGPTPSPQLPCSRPAYAWRRLQVPNRPPPRLPSPRRPCLNGCARFPPYRNGAAQGVLGEALLLAPPPATAAPPRLHSDSR